MKKNKTIGYNIIADWLLAKGRKPFPFQQQTWEEIMLGHSGLVNAPTGYGKTYSVFLGALIQYINNHPEDYRTKKNNGLQLLWITPLRALAKDIARAMQEVIEELGMPWQIGIRNGDTSTSERAKQKRHVPEVLIITPESLHLLLAQKDYPNAFKHLKIIAVDEWHELLGSKRGVQVELAISRLVGLKMSMVNGQWSMVEGERAEVKGEEVKGERSKVKDQRSKVKKGDKKGADSELTTHNSSLITHHSALATHHLNTIASLVFHINYYVAPVLKVLQGEPLKASDKYSFDLPAITSAEDWQKLVNKVLAEAEQFVEAIEQLDESILLEDFSDSKYGNYYRNLHGIIEHTHYHLGQISLIKKILKEATPGNQD